MTVISHSCWPGPWRLWQLLCTLSWCVQLLASAGVGSNSNLLLLRRLGLDRHFAGAGGSSSGRAITRHQLPGNSPVIYVQLPANSLYYHSHKQLLSLPGKGRVQRVPLSFTGNGRPHKVYHYHVGVKSPHSRPAPSTIHTSKPKKIAENDRWNTKYSGVPETQTQRPNREKATFVVPQSHNSKSTNRSAVVRSSVQSQESLKKRANKSGNSIIQPVSFADKHKQAKIVKTSSSSSQARPKRPPHKKKLRPNKNKPALKPATKWWRRKSSRRVLSSPLHLRHSNNGRPQGVYVLDSSGKRHPIFSRSLRR